MEGVLVSACRGGDARTKSPNAPAIAGAAKRLHLAIADEVAVLIVLANREASLSSFMMNPSFVKALGFDYRSDRILRATKSHQTDRNESIERWCGSARLWITPWYGFPRQ